MAACTLLIKSPFGTSFQVLPFLFPSTQSLVQVASNSSLDASVTCSSHVLNALIDAI